MLAGISEKQGLIYYKIIQGSNNTDEFANFIHGLVRKIKGEAVVYMDNFTVHYSKRVRTFFNKRVS